MNVNPATGVFLLIFLVAIFRERFSFYLFLLSIPFHQVILFWAIGRPFRLAELTMMIFMAHNLHRWMKNGEVPIPNKSATGLLLAFLAVCALSVAYAALNPPMDMLGHPYHKAHTPLDSEYLRFTGTNVTQLVLRVFFVASILTIASSLTKDRLILSLRLSVFGAILVGLIGVISQFLYLSNIRWPFNILIWFGVHSFPEAPGSLSILPRMWSVAGEPGYNASLLLYGFVISFMSLVLHGGTDIMSQKEAKLYSGMLLVFLLLSTSGTAYGGMVIFGGFFIGSFMLFRQLHRQRLIYYMIAAGTMILLVGMSLPLFNEIFVYILNKLQFQAGSGTLRYNYTLLSFDIWRDRPLLGVGVGTHSIPLVAPTILAETGIIGFTAFTLAHFSAFKRPLGYIAGEDDIRDKNMLLVISISGTTLAFTNFVSKGMIALLFPWYWVAVATAIGAVYLRIQDGTIPNHKFRMVE